MSKAWHYQVIAVGAAIGGLWPSLNPKFLTLHLVTSAWIRAGSLPPGSTVAGHSLDGHLPTAIKTSFPSIPVLCLVRSYS